MGAGAGGHGRGVLYCTVLYCAHVPMWYYCFRTRSRAVTRIVLVLVLVLYLRTCTVQYCVLLWLEVGGGEERVDGIAIG